ncbi:MAG TPA: type II toxin-antitoxin system VapC family toxin [Urbifossiella sp.]|nr:type II toxin-antitoxin system VapC family toxin [Urbifossiella sp.]
MSILVVDASVATKWFVPEVLSAEARQWQSRGDDLHAPAIFLDIEIANILWKKMVRGDLIRSDVDRILLQLPILPLVRHLEGPLIPAAVEIAQRNGRSVYDSLYLALAVHLNGQMLTADQRLVNSLLGTPMAGYVRWVGDLATMP